MGLDHSDYSPWWNYVESVFWSNATNLHPRENCVGQRACPIHLPSDHHMRCWPLNWRGDRGILERLCPCGIGHPDPDQFPWWEENNRMYEAVHGCCGCCNPINSEMSVGGLQ